MEPSLSHCMQIPYQPEPPGKPRLMYHVLSMSSLPFFLFISIWLCLQTSPFYKDCSILFQCSSTYVCILQLPSSLSCFSMSQQLLWSHGLQLQAPLSAKFSNRILSGSYCFLPWGSSPSDTSYHSHYLEFSGFMKHDMSVWSPLTLLIFFFFLNYLFNWHPLHFHINVLKSSFVVLYQKPTKIVHHCYLCFTCFWCSFKWGFKIF